LLHYNKKRCSIWFMSDAKPLDVSTLNPPLNITVVTDEPGIHKLRDFLSRVTEVGFDTETNVVDHFYHRRIRTIQIGNRDEQYVVDLLALANGNTEKLVASQGSYGEHLSDVPLLSLLAGTLRTALESNKVLKVGHNLTFDYTTIKWCLGIRPW